MDIINIKPSKLLREKKGQSIEQTEAFLCSANPPGGVMTHVGLPGDSNEEKLCVLVGVRACMGGQG